MIRSSYRVLCRGQCKSNVTLPRYLCVLAPDSPAHHLLKRRPVGTPWALFHKFRSSNISTSRGTPAADEARDSSKLSAVQKLKLSWKKYGVLTLVTYFGLYGCTLTGIFFALKTDILSASSFGLDATTVISSFCDTIESWTGNSTLPRFLRENPIYGTAVLAYIMTKFTEPVRLGIVVLAMPKIARILGRKG